MSTTRMRLVAAAWAMALLLAAGMTLATSQAWANEGLEAGEATGLQTQDDGRNYELGYTDVEDYGDGEVYYDDLAVTVRGVTSGKVTYDEKTKTLTLDNVTMDGIYLDDCSKLNVKLVGKNIGKNYFIYDNYWNGDCDVTVAGTGSVSGGIRCVKNLTMNGGSISVSKQKSGTAIDCNGNITVNGGSISVKECDGTGISCTGLTIKKGSVLVDDQFDGRSVSLHGGNLVMTGGKLTVTKSDQTAISVTSRTERTRAKTIVHGGKIKVSGGSLTAKVSKPSKTNAISADSMWNKTPLKNVAGGISAKGAKFSVSGNVYETMGDWYSDDYRVSIAKYNSKQTRVTLNKVKFGGCKYSVNGVSTKAFATKSGAKVTSITIKNSYGTISTNAFNGAKSLRSATFEDRVSKVCTNAFNGAKSLRSVTFGGGASEVCTKAFNGAKKLKSVWFSRIGKVDSNAFAGAKSLGKIRIGSQWDIQLAKNAFSGTTALTTLEFGWYDNGPFAPVYTKKGRVFKTVKWDEGAKVAKTAFAKCGKNGGKDLTVTFGEDDDDGVPKDRVSAYRNLFIKYGMPKDFMLQTREQ